MSGSRARSEVPDVAVERLPVYLRALADRDGTISSDQLAQLAGVNAAKVRKDLSHLGSYGTRGVGYDVAQLRAELQSALGLATELPVVLVGLGHLGQALARYGGFASRGFVIAGIFDADPSKIGTEHDGMTVGDSADVEVFCARHQVTLAILALPASVAQDVANRLISVGVTSLLNFAPVVLAVPPHVQVRQVDLAGELQILSYHSHAVAAER
jgi:redox-sensing transcriptional repressor